MTPPLRVEKVVALDAGFGPMAVEAGGYAAGLPELSTREKAFVWITNDLCRGHLGLPFELHVTVARNAGVSWAEIRAVLRHLAPYAGYPAVVEALVRLVRVQGAQRDPDPVPGQRATAGSTPPPPADVDTEFIAWVAGQERARWEEPLLTARERTLLCLTVDVLRQTLGAPMRAHVTAALAVGVEPETVRTLLRLMSELGMGEVWQAFEAVQVYLREHGE